MKNKKLFSFLFHFIFSYCPEPACTRNEGGKTSSERAFYFQPPAL